MRRETSSMISKLMTRDVAKQALAAHPANVYTPSKLHGP